MCAVTAAATARCRSLLLLLVSLRAVLAARRLCCCCYSLRAIPPPQTRMPERQALLQELHASRCDIFLRGRPPTEADFCPEGGKPGGKGSPKFWKQAERRAALRVKMESAAYRLHEHDLASCQLLKSAGRQNVGLAFVTFEEPASAERAMRAVDAAPAPAASTGPLPALTGSFKLAPVKQTRWASRAEERLLALGAGRRLIATRAPEPSDVLCVSRLDPSTSGVLPPHCLASLRVC